MPIVDQDRPFVEAVLHGDHRAFRALVERNGPVLYSLLRRLVRDPETVEELAQETFVRGYENLARFRGGARFRTWLIQIAINLLRDRRRVAARSPTVVSLEELRERRQRGGDPPDEGPSSQPDVSLTRKEIASRLEAEILRLPLDYREAFVLRHCEGLSYQEIAESTGCSAGTLKVRAHRARVRLRQALLTRETGRSADARATGSLP